MKTLGGFLIGACFGWAGATGIWLVTLTDYPYDRVVGGATLVTATLCALVGFMEEDL